MFRTARQLWLASATCAVAFGALLAVVYGTDTGEDVDAIALEGFGDLQRPRIAELSDEIAHLADPVPFAVLSAVLILVALARRRVVDAAVAGFLLACANVTTQVLKPALATPRGTVGDYYIAAEAFPSGHATASMSLALAAVVVVPARWRPLTAVAGAAFALAVSFSIVSLDWHFPSDIAGGFLVAAGWCFAALALARLVPRRRRGREAAAAWGQVGLAVLVLVAGAAAVGASRLPDLTHYAEGHTIFAVVAAATAALGAAIVGAVAVAAGRR